MAAAADYSLPPGEILMEILVKLPCIKSLVRCTSVCKSWYSLIKDPYFIAQHLSYQNNYNSCSSKYLFCSFACTDIHELDATGEPFPYSIHYDNKAFSEYYKLEFPGGRLKSGRTVHGYCNGLICYSRVVNIASGTRSLYLWNPTIKKLKILPKFIRNPKAHGNHLAFGFGFDPKFKDYKVLKIGYTREASVVELYSLNSNSWTLISDCGPGSCYEYSHDHNLVFVNGLGSCYGYSHHNLVFVNGTFYWVAHRGCVQILVSLDMKNNTIRETIMSHSFSLGTLGVSDLLVVFGLSSHYKWHKVYCSDIRLYDEYFDEVLKIDGFKELDSEGEGEYLMPIGFRNNGQVVLWKNFRNYAYCSTMVSYNLETRKAKDFGEKISRRPYYVEPFVESLVLLNDGDARGLTPKLCRRKTKE